MKRITALLHPQRLAEVVHALEAAGERRLSVVQARGLLQTANNRTSDYSVELGERVTQEFQLEVFCDDDKLEALVGVIRRLGRSGHQPSGWVFVSPVESGQAIDGAAPAHTRS